MTVIVKVPSIEVWQPSGAGEVGAIWPETPWGIGEARAVADRAARRANVFMVEDVQAFFFADARSLQAGLSTKEG